MKYYGYIRVSTETQASKGFGLDAQREAVERYAAQNAIELAEVFTDAGISSNLSDTDDDDAITKRAGLMDLLAHLDEGDTVIVLNTSRLWRSDLTKALVRRELMRKNAKVIDIEHPTFDLYKTSKDPAAYLINAITEALDVYDRMNISLKLARGRTVKANKGDKPSGVTPYGYRYSDDKKSIIVDEGEAVIVKKMYTEAQKGKSLQNIADMLNNSGEVTRNGNLWAKGGISVILHNRFYIGELTHAGKVIQGNHHALISKIQFGKVQAQLDRKHK